ncbi:MAG: prepilin-type N-terminal cleavage/methylation domain-containing protein [Lachnospirales bacterium]
MNFKIQKKRKAFTLVELIVVIAIIIILAALAVPRVTKYIEESRDAKRVADFHSVNLALQAATVDLRANNIEGVYFIQGNMPYLMNLEGYFYYRDNNSPSFNEYVYPFEENVNSMLDSKFYVLCGSMYFATTAGTMGYYDNVRGKFLEGAWTSNSLSGIQDIAIYSPEQTGLAILDFVADNTILEGVVNNAGNIIDNDSSANFYNQINADSNYNTWEVYVTQPSGDYENGDEYTDFEPVITVINDGYISVDGSKPLKIINYVEQ